MVLKVPPETSSVDTTWELVLEAESQVPLPACRIRNPGEGPVLCFDKSSVS